MTKFIKLYFDAIGYVTLSISSVQNDYREENLLPISIDKDDMTLNVFGAETLHSVFPVFTTEEPTYFKFEHNGKISNCIKVGKNDSISSFIVEDVVYGLEILGKAKQDIFEINGGHSCKDLTVWLGVDVCEYIYGGSEGYDEVDSCATVAVNDTSTDVYENVHFREPIMNKRIFNFCFK